MGRIRKDYMVSEKNLEYIEEVKEKNYFKYSSEALELIIREHRENEKMSIKMLREYLANEISEALKDEFKIKTKVLDEERIHKAIRATMSTLERKCGYKDLVWSASLHYNTKHIHVHVATVQLNPDERGKREYKVLRAMKSSFANSLSDFSKEYKEINDIIRERLVDNRKKYDFKKDKMMKENVKEIIKLLPKDKRQWNYNYNSLQEVKPYLDEITRNFIEDNFKEDYNLLVGKLEEQEIKLKNMYGEKNTSLYKYYKENKIDDLYTRMGNVTLKQIKDYVYENENKKFINSNKEPIVTSRAIK
ncbi:relaxase MobL [Clostridium perfringens]|uniref:relaxase MobL n=1 Tax=Clostridium perfringens TaxID=1502 RepID=UPI0002F5BE4E|nr:relaxase MobL [Clostridium perfringens]